MPAFPQKAKQAQNNGISTGSAYALCENLKCQTFLLLAYWQNQFTS
jgi:hypothetical protein